MHTLSKYQSALSFCFHQHGFENHFTGLDSCHQEFIINIHKAGMLRFATLDLQRKLPSKFDLPQNDPVLIPTYFPA